MKSIVSICRCENYDSTLVQAAVDSCVSLAGGFSCQGKKVLVKPNMLSANAPEKAVTTHPEVLRAFIRLCRAGGASLISVGDSPGWQSGNMVGDASGLRAVTREEGAQWANFQDSVMVDLPEGSLLKRIPIARAVIEADVLVSLPKLKTHQLIYFTGASKNLLGVVPGLSKSQFHLRFPDRRQFSEALVDIALAAKPAFALMDAVVGMEGHGPGNGDPRAVGLILASPDIYALDWIAASIIGYDPAAIPNLAQAHARALFDPDGIHVAGEDPKHVVVPGFKLISVMKDMDIFKRFFPKPIHALVRDMTVARPFFSRKRCIACGGCIKICPANALSFKRDRRGRKHISVDYKRCIRCYCCDEICPERAITLRRRP